MKLTEKQKRFADYYIEAGNATEAYKKAYGCKNDTARKNGSRLLTNADISLYIKERMDEVSKERILTAEQVLEELTKIATGQNRALGIKFVPTQDRVRALELIGKRYKMWVDKQEIEGSISPVVIVRGDPNAKRN